MLCIFITGNYQSTNCNSCKKKKLNTKLKLLEYSSPKTAEINCKYIFVILCEGTIKYSRAKLIHYKQVFYNQNHMLVEEKAVSKLRHSQFRDIGTNIIFLLLSSKFILRKGTTHRKN